MKGNVLFSFEMVIKQQSA